jgi:hypothetical protein
LLEYFHRGTHIRSHNLNETPNTDTSDDEHHSASDNASKKTASKYSGKKSKFANRMARFMPDNKKDRK